MQTQYFVGKVCTILTRPINHNYSPEQMIVYFTGIVEKMDDTGIIIRQLQSSLKTYFNPQHVIAVAEEEVVGEATHPTPPPIKTTSGPQLDPLAMSKLAKELKNGS